jgi:hypothetical protein
MGPDKHWLPADRGPLRTGLRTGIGLALACCASAILAYLARGIEPLEPFTSLWSVLGALLTSGIAGGITYGFLARWRSTPTGRFALGAAITFVVCCMIALFSPESGASALDDLRSLVMFTLAGGVVGLVGFRPRRR